MGKSHFHLSVRLNTQDDEYINYRSCLSYQEKNLLAPYLAVPNDITCSCFIGVKGE